jgi:hypothetical protein
MALHFASALLVVSLLAVGPAHAKGGATRATSDPCGRAASLEAAKEALARGEREEALEHLRRAEARLDRCSPPPEGTRPDAASEQAEPALAFGVRTNFPAPLS